MVDEILLWKFLKFCIVGFTGMGIDFGTTWLLKEKVRVNKYVANSAGFIFAASSNFALNRFWTFHSETPQIVVQYISFLSVSVIGLGINNLVVYILNDRFRLNFYFSKLFAIAVVTLWNFLLNYFITFNLF